MLQNCYKSLCTDCINMQWITMVDNSSSYPPVDKIIHQSYPPVGLADQMAATPTGDRPRLGYIRAGKLQAERRRAAMIKGAVINETASYIYTREVVSYTESRYYIDFELKDGRTAIGCTVYHTMEEAQANIARDTRIFGYSKESASIREEQYNGFKVVRHRYKKG